MVVVITVNFYSQLSLASLKKVDQPLQLWVINRSEEGLSTIFDECQTNPWHSLPVLPSQVSWKDVLGVYGAPHAMQAPGKHEVLPEKH